MVANWSELCAGCGVASLGIHREDEPLTRNATDPQPDIVVDISCEGLLSLGIIIPSQDTHSGKPGPHVFRFRIF